jgi:hypothetical protein
VVDFVRYVLGDEGQVYFESSEGSLVSLRAGGDPDVAEGGRLGERLREIAVAADLMASSLRERLGPDEIKLEFGVKVAGEVNWWFFAKNSAEGSIGVTLTWRGGADKGVTSPGVDDGGNLGSAWP